MSRLESDYYAHMGFDPAHAREVLGFYVPMFVEHGPVLELACGRGEFLGLLAEAGVDAVGVDSDEGMAETAAANGRKVIVADAVEYLHGDPAPGPFNGVFCAHFVEHLTPEQLVRLLAGVRRVLPVGGRFVAATPNPACYAVLTHDFWRDPTHVRFYDPPLLEFLCRQAGLEVEGSGPNPANHPGPPPWVRAPEMVVHPDMDDAILEATAKIEMALGHGQPRGLRAPRHDPSWALELAHIVKVLTDRLTATQESLQELRRAHEKLIWQMYESNEVYVSARG